MTLQDRVLQRYILAKAEPVSRLAADLVKAIVAFEAGDDAPVVAVLEAVKRVFNPHGNASNGIDYPSVPWLMALGDIKRRNVLRIQDAASSLILEIGREAKSPDKYGYGRENITKKLHEYAKKLKSLDTYIKAVVSNRVERDGFTLVKLPGVSDEEQEQAITALLTAAEAVRKKFPQVCYGEVFLSTHLTNASGSYLYNSDTIQLSVRAQRRFSDVYTLVHEFGHRYDNKFVDKDLRWQFSRLSSVTEYEELTFDVPEQKALADELVSIVDARKAGRPMPKMSPRLEAWMTYRHMLDRDKTKKAMSAYMSGTGTADDIHAVTVGSHPVTVKTEKVVREPLSVTPYGATNVKENFAEAFAHYVLGMDMAPEFVELFKQMG